MKFLHKIRNRIVLKIVLVILIISFTFTGIINYLINKNNNYIIKINNQEISVEQLNYEFLKNKEKIKFNIDENFIKQQTIYDLINKSLLFEYANKIGLVVDDDYIKKSIISNKNFFLKNKFNNNKFHQIIEKYNLSIEQYVDLLRKDLVIKQLIDNIINTDFFLPKEINKIIQLYLQVREVKLAVFDINKFSKEQNISETDIVNNYINNKDKYSLNEAIKVVYFPIKLEKILNEIIIEEKDIKQWYNKNINKFNIEIKKKYNLIYIKKEIEAIELLKKIKQKPNSFKIYKNINIKYVDTDWITDDDIPYELKKLNLNIKGQLSNIIKLQQGFLIAKLNNIKESKIKLTDLTYEEIIKKIKEEKANNRFYEIKNILESKKKYNNTSLQKIKSEIKFQETNWFNIDSIPKELNYYEIKQFFLKKIPYIKNNKLINNNTNLISINENFLISIRIINYSKKYLQSINEVRDEIYQKIKKEIGKRKAKLYAEEMILLLKKDKNKAIKNLINIGINFSNKKSFYYDNQNDSISKAVFLIKPKKEDSSYGITVTDEENIVLISLDKITLKSIDNNNYNLLLNNLNKKITSAILNSLIENLYKKSIIKINI